MTGVIKATMQTTATDKSATVLLMPASKRFPQGHDCGLSSLAGQCALEGGLRRTLLDSAPLHPRDPGDRQKRFDGVGLGSAISRSISLFNRITSGWRSVNVVCR